VGRLIVLSLVLSFPALAAPKGGTVVSGAADINQNGSVTDINQGSKKAVINWQGFSIAGHETVNFNQPSASAIALNRVTGNEKSVIDGALNANGQVFIVNSNGVLFGKGASVNAGGLVATTLDIADEDFNNDNYSFKGQKSGGEVVNMGNITAAENGYVALMGEKVRNEGVIVAERGTVSLNGAKKTTLNFNGDSLVNVSLDEGALDALVESKNAIVADGGRVFLTAKAADDVVASQVNTDGIIEAKTLGELKGSVEVYAHGGTAKIAGKLDASAPSGGDGGFIETSGDKVIVADDAVITTKSEKGKSGTWLIDPKDFTIAASGGDVTGQTLGSNLANGNVKIESTKGQKDGAGDINVNDAVSWASASTLTLDAYHDININNAININGSGTLILLPGADGDFNIRTPASYSGAEVGPDGYPVARVDDSGGVYGSVNYNGSNGALYIGGTESDNKYTLIYDLSGLRAVNNVKGNYALAKNLDLAYDSFTSGVVGTLAGGSVFTGLGHTVSNLTINATAGSVGFFGSSDFDTMIRDIGIVNPTIVKTTDTTSTGALVGSSSSDVKNAYVKGGSVTGVNNVGGLLGRLLGYPNPLTVVDVFSTAEISGQSMVGGLIGYMQGQSSLISPNTVIRSHATGNVTILLPLDSGKTYGQMGGLIGNNNLWVTIKDSYATGNINGGVLSGKVEYLGGLMGRLYSTYSANSLVSTVDNCFATGQVIGGTYVGGLIGSVYPMLSLSPSVFINLTNSYATGKVIGTGIGYSNSSAVGGLIGYVYVNRNSIVTITNVYATGNVEAQLGNIGGLVGLSTAPANGGSWTISQSHASGDVKSYLATGAESTAGGLVGTLRNGTIENSYATGNVATDGSNSAGGLVGVLSYSTVIGSYATGNVTARYRAGGLVGGSLNSNSIIDSYATGIATVVYPAHSSAGAGGLLGLAYSPSTVTIIENSYWNEANEVGYNSQGTLTSTESGGVAVDQLNDSEIVQGIINGLTPTDVINARIAAAEAAAQAAAIARVETIVEVSAVADKEQLKGNQIARSGAPVVSLANIESVSLETAIAGYPDQFGTYAATGGSEVSYGASIQSVTADGVTYFVDEEDEESKE
jgi:filamentous hemagglutinin family protein